MDINSFLDLQIKTIVNVPFSVAVKWILENYINTRIDGAELDSDGDMLLYQYGSYVWDGKNTRSIDLSRQVILDIDDDQVIHQICCKYIFNGVIIDRGNKWCNNPNDLDSYSRHILSNIQYLSDCNLEPLKIKISIYIN